MQFHRPWPASKDKSGKKFVSKVVAGKIIAVNTGTGLITASYVDHTNVEQQCKLDQAEFIILESAQVDMQDKMPWQSQLPEETSLIIDPLPDVQPFKTARTEQEFNRLVFKWSDRCLRLSARRNRARLRQVLTKSKPADITIDASSFPLSILEPFYSFMDLSLLAAVLSSQADTSSLTQALEIMRKADGYLAAILLSFEFRPIFGAISLWQRARQAKQSGGQELLRKLKDTVNHDCLECLEGHSCLDSHECCLDTWKKLGVRHGWLLGSSNGKHILNLGKTKRRPAGRCQLPEAQL